MNIKEKLGKEILIFDGAMGTMIQDRGLELGELPEILNISDSKKIIDIHKKYIDSGANIISTNTFGANEIKLKESSYSVEELIDAGVKNAREAIGDRDVYIALDIGPIGELLEPMGSLSFEKAYEIYKRQILQGVKSGVDLVLFETMTDLYEVKAAILAAKENSDLAIFCTMTYEENFRTFTGVNLESMVMVLEGLNVDALGLNCSLGPRELEPLVDRLIDISSSPIIIQANAGLPSLVGGETLFNIQPKEFANYGLKFVKRGVNIIGGCCGTDDSHIRLLKKSISGIRPREIKAKMTSGVSTPTNTLMIDRIRVVGERINPSGKEVLKKALIDGDMDYVLKEAIAQEKAGAHILDINVGIPEIDEKKTMVEVIRAIQSLIDIPLQIDSTDPEVIEAALRIYNGKALVNSVNGEDTSLDSILPLIKKYGGLVIGLTLDEDGIPKKMDGRLRIARKIIKRAEGYGIGRENIIIDSLTLTAAAQQEDLMESLKTLTRLKSELGVKTTLGVSNVSFGLPNRELINKTFLAAALFAGLDMPIMDPLDKEMMDTIRASRVLWNEDLGAKEYLDNYELDGLKGKTKLISSEANLFDLIVKGLREEASKLTRELLKNEEALDIIDRYIIPALDSVGEKYEDGEIFLPQLIRSAETVNSSFEIIRAKLLETSLEDISKGKILLATVEGDIHDIGKNIVKVLLQSYNYHVYDLGKNVAKEKILASALENNIKLVGLSALMTTTVKSMEETIKELKDKDPSIRVMVGGAVLNEKYSKMIGADYYAKDAKEAVNIARNFLD